MTASNNNNKLERSARLHWSERNSRQPCFCDSPVLLDLTKLQPTPETLAALFGVTNANDIVPMQNGQECWDLQPNQDFEIISMTGGEEKDDFIPLKHIFNHLPGATPDEKDDKLNQLTLQFYNAIWHGPDVPPDFRKYFTSKTSTAKIQAFRQYNWFMEVFGGPGSLHSPADFDNILVRKTMAKHTKSHMTVQHCITWIKLMNQTVQQEFPNQPALRRALSLYWLHFYAFFPLSDEERRELRRHVVL